MIDNITIRFKDKVLADQIFKSKDDYDMKVSRSGGEIKTSYCKIGNLRVRSTSTFTELTGSLHTFFNMKNKSIDGNYDDFSYTQIIKALDSLEEIFGCPLSEMRLINFEFGFNLVVPYDPTFLIEEKILLYKFRAPCINPQNEKNKKIKIFTQENYMIKIYDKSKESNLSHHVLRMEIVFRSKDLFNKMGIDTLSDLKNKDVYVNMFEYFMLAFENLIIIDCYCGTEEMSRDLRLLLSMYTNPTCWINLKKNGTKHKYLKHRMLFLEKIKDYGLDSKKKELRALLNEKFVQLLNS